MGMKRLCVLSCGVLAMASGAALAAPAKTPPRAQLQHFRCQTARDPAARGIDLWAVMRPVPHTMRMAMRFDLFEKPRRSGAATKLRAGGLGVWIYPTSPKTLGQRPGDVWYEHHPIAQLSIAPAYYKVKVTFRWIGTHNRTLATAVRNSPICFQPELRPDLAVAAIGVRVSPTNPNRDIYSALVRNLGASSAGPFGVQIADGSVIKTKTVQLLDAHSKTVVSFVGPLCDPLAPPTVTVDPTGQIDDFNRANNALNATCP
jgi:CARDB